MKHVPDGVCLVSSIIAMRYHRADPAVHDFIFLCSFLFHVNEVSYLFVFLVWSWVACSGVLPSACFTPCLIHLPDLLRSLFRARIVLSLLNNSFAAAAASPSFTDFNHCGAAQSVNQRPTLSSGISPITGAPHIPSANHIHTQETERTNLRLGIPQRWRLCATQPSGAASQWLYT